MEAVVRLHPTVRVKAFGTFQTDSTYQSVTQRNGTKESNIHQMVVGKFHYQASNTVLGHFKMLE
jgi:hypothetical protein